MSRRRGRPRGDHGKRQREIADILLKVVGERGFTAASMRVLAREARCTTGVLTHYFCTKEELVCHAVDLLFDWAEERATKAAETGDSLKALEIALDAPKEARRPLFDFWAVWLQVLAKTRQSDRLTKIVVRRHGRYRDLLTRIVREGQRHKQIRSDISAPLLADQINAVSDGLGLMAPLEAERLSRHRSRKLLRISLGFIRA